MKATTKTRRKAALERLISSTWENSKAKRKGTKSREQWQKWKDAHIEFLSKKV